MFQAPKLTNAGKALYYENMAGTQLMFTTIKMGSGTLSKPIANLINLVNTVVTIPAGVSVNEGYVNVAGAFSNVDLTEGFYWREIGIFAANPNDPTNRAEDILYCYQNAYDTADYIPVASVETVEKNITVPIIVGDAASVSCTLSKSQIYGTVQDLENHNTDITAHSDIRSELNDKAAANHSHDDRYYTENEIDTKLNGKLGSSGDGSNVTAAFVAATIRENLSTGEKLSVIFGKIKKWFTDLGSLAFKSTVAMTDLTDDVQYSLDKADTAVQIEIDPTVPEWAKQPSKPSYTYSEIMDMPTSFPPSTHSHSLDDINDLDVLSGTKTARFVIGTSTVGWTSNDCDYLCDGTADQIEINNAIQALPSAGGEIVILDGTYNIASKIDVNKSNVNIKGNGNATVLKRMYNGGTAEGIIHVENVNCCKVENLKIDGNLANYSISYDGGVCLKHSNNNTIINITCYNEYHGIYLLYSDDNIIIGNVCISNKVGIDPYESNNNIITGNACSNNNSGIEIGLDSDDNMIISNACNHNNDYGIRVKNSKNNTITSNICNNNNCGIRLYAATNHTVVGNTCIRGEGKSSDYTSDQYTIHLYSTYNHYNQISSNNCKGKAVVIDGGTSNDNDNNKYN